MSERSERTIDTAPGERSEHGAWQRPLPETDPVSERYWAAAAEGRLLIQRCAACGHRQHYPRAVCTACGATPEWEEASGRGTVYTYTIVRQYGMPPFDALVPYVVAMIDLVEGPRLMSNVVDCAPEEVHIGMEVEAVMRIAEPGVGVPFFRPTAGVGERAVSS